MSRISKHGLAGWKCGAGLVALSLATAAHAQNAPAEEPADEAAAQSDTTQNGAAAPTPDGDIVVTGTRLASGFLAPTPVLVNSTDQLKSTAPNIADAVQFLPVFRNSTNPRTQNTSSLREQGAAFLNLRGLTPQRTLVLVNGRRYITSGTSGAVDMNTIPQDVIQRVEIVTGGASAAYGSDAVAGVVNFILDNKFEGVRASGQAGISRYGDAGTRGGALTAGTSFAGGDGHILVSADYLKQDGVGATEGLDRDWFNAFYGIIPNGAQRVIAAPIVWSNATPGGLITSGVLANQQFRPGGTLEPFVAGQYRNANSMIGGSGVPAYVPLVSGLDRWSVFGRAQYELGGDITLWAEGTYAQSTVEADTQFTFINGSAAFTIFSDNAYLPENVRNAMAGADQTSFRMGRLMNDFGVNHFYARSRAMRLTTGLDWKIGGDWEVSAYYMYGRNRFNNSYSIQNLRRLHAAADAVVNPANGQIVCRSTLQGYDAGCVPVNLFGLGAPSVEAVNWINGTPTTHLTLREDVASLIARGPLLGLPGGDLSIAGGIEYRREAADQVADDTSKMVNSAEGLRGFPTSLAGVVGGWPYANTADLNGSYNVKEAFVEFQAPLLADMPFAHSLTLNGAARLIDYSTVGSVWTWKAGVTWEPFADLRFRVTRSRDIRAGNVIELFQSESRTTQFAIINGTTAEVRNVRSGNPNLDPERADTLTFGAVYRPSWLPRFGISVDFFDIKVNGAIFQFNTQQTIDQCALNNQTACDQITTGDQGIIVRTPTLNLASVKTRGIDVEMNYNFDVGPGSIRVRGLLSYLDKLETTLPFGNPIDRAGDIGVQAAPKFTGNLQLTYAQGPFSLDVQGRYLGSGKQDNTFGPGVIEDNHVPAVFYTDLTGRIRLGDDENFELFATVNNLFDKDPPVVPTAIANNWRSTNFSLYDVLGRYITVGAKVRF